MPKWTPEWKREGNLIYALGERGYNRVEASFYHHKSQGAEEGEAEATAERARACLTALAGRDPSQLAELEAAADYFVRVYECVHVDPEEKDGCERCLMIAALRAFRCEGE